MTVPFGAEYTCDPHGEAHPCPYGCPETDAARTARLLGAVRDGAWLDAQSFPPLRWAVPGIVPEGFTLLVGAPKAGKSWLTLSTLLAVSAGGVALERIEVPKGRTLYLALEDGHARMQDRCRTLMDGEALPPDYHYAVRVTPADVLDTIDAFVSRYTDTSMVVIDTLGKVMPPAMPNETTYSRDYRIGGRLKSLTDAHSGLALVVVHHDRKAGADDFVERVSGTNGLAGAADTIVVLSRDRQSTDGTLSVTGRDVDEGEYALTFAGGSWALDGDDLGGAARTARERAAVEGVGDRLADVIRYVGEHPDGVGPTEVAAALGLDNAATRAYLSRALSAGRVDRIRRGVYVGVASVAMHNGRSMHGNDSNTQHDLPEVGEWLIGGAP